jgi:hypothetical protein
MNTDGTDETENMRFNGNGIIFFRKSPAVWNISYIFAAQNVSGFAIEIDLI